MADTQGIQDAQKTFDWSSQEGQALLQKLGISQDQAQQMEQQYGDVARNYFTQQLQSGGFNADETAGVLGTTGQNGVPGLGDLSGVSAGEANANFLTPDEQTGIKGNPNDPLGYLHSDTIGQYMQNGDESQDTAVGGLKSGLSSAIDPSKLALSSRYGTDVTGQLGATKGQLDSTTGNPDLQLSSEFAKDYQLTPEQQQDIVNSAATDVSNKYQGEVEDSARKANAAGIGTLGQSALRDRLLRQGASDAADEQTKARIAASSEAASRQQQAEAMRLGAQQDIAGLQTQAGEFEGTQGLGALTQEEQMRLGSEQDISNRQLQAATTGGQADIANRQAETQTNIGAVENVRNAEVAAQQTAEEQAAQRAAGIAQDRQTTQQTNSTANYNRGAAANQALSQRYGSVGSTRIGQQNTGGQYFAGGQQLYNQNQQGDQQQQVGAFGTTGQLQNQSAGVITGQNTSQNNQPGTGSKILGGILGGLGALFEDGGVVDDGPMLGHFGEAGPEKIVDWDGKETMIRRPTKAIIGERGPAKVIPMTSRHGDHGRMPFKKRYGT